MSLIRPILAHALRSPRRTAVVDDRRSYSYLQLAGGAMFVARHVKRTTDKPHVGIMLPTSGAFPISLLGVWMAGRTAVPLNYLLKPEELRYVIEDSGIDTLLTAGPMLDFIGGESVIPSHVRVVKLETLSFKGVPPLRWPPNPGADELAVLLYTSGTSGKPKGVMLTHGNLHADVDAAIKAVDITKADTFLGVLPQFHSFGLTALTLMPLRIGAKAVYTARFLPKRIIELMREHRPEVFMGIPSMYGALLAVKDAAADDFKSIRLAVSGGEPLPQAVYDGMRDRFNITMCEGYGLTETSPVSNWSTTSQAKRSSVGKALPGVRNLIVDEHNKPLPANHDGEILIAGPILMKGYYRLPELTAEVFVELTDPLDGKTKRFFRTGDIGRLDDDGMLYITGRKKEMIIVGGENVFPREIEEVLNQHESVRSSAVVGKQDGTRGEVPIAFVETHPDKAFDETALRAWCRKHLAGYKVPREIRHLPELPRNPTGKILRRELKAN